MNTALSAQNHAAYFETKDLSIDDLVRCCNEVTALKDYPLASEIINNIVVYRAEVLYGQLTEFEKAIRSELASCLKDGPGVFIIKGAYPDKKVIDQSTDLFRQIVEEEKAHGIGQGDHFGNNERIWNVSQKVCERSPDTFIDYYSNPFIALACKAWLGPAFQLTAQMNTVKPGSKSQVAHRDYHLGFQSRQTITEFPAHAQVMSQFLTLQGAIAHSDMPLEMGPTLFLPHSQKVSAGYLSFLQDEAKSYFNKHCTQIPLEKGDMVFFNPALMHGAGANQTQTDRVANLLQISSAFGRPMETVNRLKMIKAIYGSLKERYHNGMTEKALEDTIAMVADGYSFPTNLDSDPPINGNAPKTAQQMLQEALTNNATLEDIENELMAYAQRQSA